jgi:hypothetical protein
MGLGQRCSEFRSCVSCVVISCEQILFLSYIRVKERKYRPSHGFIPCTNSNFYVANPRAVCCYVTSSILYAEIISESRSLYLRHTFFTPVVPLRNRAQLYGWIGINTCLCLEGHEVEPIPGGPPTPAMCKMWPFYLCNAARCIVSENQNKSRNQFIDCLSKIRESSDD